MVVYGSSLHMAGIAASLQAEPGLDVTCVDSHSPNARQTLDNMNPTTIAFDLSDTDGGLDVNLVRDQPGLLLIGVDPSSDKLLVLSSRSMSVLSVADLVEIIRHERKNL